MLLQIRILLLTIISTTVNVLVSESAAGFHSALPALRSGETVSQLDGETQRLLYWAPDRAVDEPAPLFVFLHSWSGDYKQDNSKWLSQAVSRGWIYVHPNFRGINKTPKACGSRFARQDILDAIDFICGKFKVDRQRIYLAGVSGGGHMAMLMAGHHPNRFSAVSAWVGVGDLADWHGFHVKNGVPQNYARMIEQSLGGAPGKSPTIDADYRDRSPVFHLHQVGDLPISIYAGVQDGHTGSVPIRHSLRGFNAIAAAANQPVVTDEEMDQLWQHKRLLHPQVSDVADDPDFGRRILLRRRAANAVVTVFDGGHESLPNPACDWLAGQRRKLNF